MDIMKRFYEQVRIKQILAFFVKAHENNCEYIPLIVKESLIFTSMHDFSPVNSPNIIKKCTHFICHPVETTTKKKTQCKTINVLITFNDYMYLYVNQTPNKELKLPCKRQNSENSENSNKSEKLTTPTTPTIDFSVATNSSLSVLLEEFQKEIDEVKKKYPTVLRSLRDNQEKRKPFLEELQIVKEKYTNLFKNQNFDETLLTVDALEEGEVV